MQALRARIREVTGKKTKTLLKEGKIPAVLYGPGIENLNLEIDEKEFEKIARKKTENLQIILKVEEKEYQVEIKEVQREPIKGKIIHIDFYKLPTK